MRKRAPSATFRSLTTNAKSSYTQDSSLPQRPPLGGRGAHPAQRKTRVDVAVQE
jgi:hypothetical protein